MFVQEKIDNDLKPEEKLVTLEEFWNGYPDGFEGRFELHNGVIVKVQPTGTHEQVAGFLAMEIGFEIKRLNLPLFIPRQGLIKAIDTDKSAYIPDVMILDHESVKNNEPMWKKRSTITQGNTVKLAIEVVSTNWQDDYARKVEEYAFLNVPEYWLVDFRGLGGIQFIGNPKQPTFTICQLVNGVYQQQQYRLGDTIYSPLFPNLQLKLDDVMPA